MSYPSIGIVTPSFNQAVFIQRTIESILSQKYPNLEYWVIDGGSTDGTVDILKTYSRKIRWISEKDAGQTHAINKGMRKLNSDIVCYLNSDDLLVPGALDIVASQFSAGSIDWLTGSYEIIDENDKPIQTHSFIPAYKKFLLRHYSTFLLKSTNSIIPQPSTFWSRKAMNNIGYFNESLRYTMDYEYWLRLSRYYTPRIIPNVLSQFRIHKESKSGSQYKKQFAEELRVLRADNCTTVEYLVHLMHTLLTLGAYSMLK